MLHAAREAGLSAQTELAGRSLKGQLKQADRLRARYVAVVQEDHSTLTDTRQNTQRTIDSDTVVESVLRAGGESQ